MPVTIQNLHHCRHWIRLFGVANYESFFTCSESNTKLLQLFNQLYITHMFQKKNY